jgi:hypothetical protein
VYFSDAECDYFSFNSWYVSATVQTADLLEDLLEDLLSRRSAIRSSFVGGVLGQLIDERTIDRMRNPSSSSSSSIIVTITVANPVDCWCCKGSSCSSVYVGSGLYFASQCSQDLAQMFCVSQFATECPDVTAGDNHDDGINRPNFICSDNLPPPPQPSYMLYVNIAAVAALFFAIVTGLFYCFCSRRETHEYSPPSECF